MSAVLATTPDGRSQVLERDDGTIVAVGWAEAPSGERIVTEQVVRYPPPKPDALVETRLAGGGSIKVAIPAVESPLARAMRYEAARLKAMENYGRPAAAPPPWTLPAKPEPTQEEILRDARERAHRLEVLTEDDRRWAALKRIDGRPGLAAELDAAHELAERIERGETIPTPPPAVDPAVVGTFADPVTRQFVADQAAEAKATADLLFDAWAKGDYRGPTTITRVGMLSEMFGGRRDD